MCRSIDLKCVESSLLFYNYYGQTHQSDNVKVLDGLAWDFSCITLKQVLCTCMASKKKLLFDSVFIMAYGWANHGRDNLKN